MEKSGTMSEKKRVPGKTASKENFIQANAEPPCKVGNEALVILGRPL
jgi:hypothetical protein